MWYGPFDALAEPDLVVAAGATGDDSIVGITPPCKVHSGVQSLVVARFEPEIDQCNLEIAASPGT